MIFHHTLVDYWGVWDTKKEDEKKGKIYGSLSSIPRRADESFLPITETSVLNICYIQLPSNGIVYVVLLISRLLYEQARASYI